MSNDSVDEIHIRLREEIDQIWSSMAEAARDIGESSSQGLRDVCAGRKRTTAELLARLALEGADAGYILTGKRTEHAPSKQLPSDEQLLLDTYRAMSVTRRKALLADLLTGGKGRSSGGVVASGNNSRAAGRDYLERK